MSIADAVRARELEARVATLCRTTALIQGQVAELERRMALIEELRPTSTHSDRPEPTPPNIDRSKPSPQGRAFVENLAQAGRSKYVKANDAA